MSTCVGTGVGTGVNNVYGDFSYAVLDTIRGHLHHVKPQLGFDVSQQHDQPF